MSEILRHKQHECLIFVSALTLQRCTNTADIYHVYAFVWICVGIFILKLLMSKC